VAIWIGTSGYNYPEWRGSFYPHKFATTKMLAFYAERLATVEINYTFYRSPRPAILAGWSRETPLHFKFTLKAPKRITHDARLRDCGEPLRRFIDTAATLGPKLGMLLFQLPPFFRKDVAVLDAFLEEFPRETRAAFEFRHVSWFDDEVFARLKARNLTLCIADSEKLSTPVELTADCAYFRLRDEGYTPDDIERWARTIENKTSRCREVFVYFKHEEAGKGPQFARLLMDALGQSGARDT
jgi:uncharacterized protein YecE (DUF72 family)